MQGSSRVYIKTTFPPEDKSKPPLAVYLVGILGFIPLIGAIVGVVLIVLGIAAYRSWKLIVIGAAGIIWSVLVYGSLFIFTQSKTMGKLMVPSARESLSNLAKEIEFYKYENGIYPDSLQQLERGHHLVFIWDPTQPTFKKPIYFQYKNLGDHYILFSVGPDGIAHTSDDIFPVIPDTGRIHYGWINP